MCLGTVQSTWFAIFVMSARPGLAESEILSFFLAASAAKLVENALLVHFGPSISFEMLEDQLSDQVGC